MTRYHILTAEREELEEVSEELFFSVMGEGEVKNHASLVYYGKENIEDVPAELRDEVLAVVENKTARWGLPEDWDISGEEFTKMLNEVM